MDRIGILFDLDGTLLDTLEDLTDAVNYMLRQFNCPERSIEEIRRRVGNGPLNLVTLALPENCAEPSPQQALQIYKSYYEAHSRIKTKPYDGVTDALERLSRKFPIAVVSNKQDAAVKTLCKNFFPGIYAQGEIADCPRKPAPDMLFMAMKVIGVDTCIYVGDSDVDVLTAKNAGVPCVAVTWGFRSREILEKSGARHFCDSPFHLADKLEEMICG